MNFSLEKGTESHVFGTVSVSHSLKPSAALF